MRWEVEFYKDSSGKEPVIEFLNTLPSSIRAKVARLLDLLSEQGVLLKEPYTRQIRGKLRELRIKDHLGNIRIIYFTFTGRRLILLHGFIKKTDKTPRKEIELSEKRMKDYIGHFGGEL